MGQERKILGMSREDFKKLPHVDDDKDIIFDSLVITPDETSADGAEDFSMMHCVAVLNWQPIGRLSISEIVLIEGMGGGGLNELKQKHLSAGLSNSLFPPYPFGDMKNLLYQEAAHDKPVEWAFHCLNCSGLLRIFLKSNHYITCRGTDISILEIFSVQATRTKCPQ